jgi:outer membrane receptor for ferrienterochelin and colicin
MAVVLLGLPVRAEEIDDFEELDLEKLLDVVYTAARHKQDIAESPSAITVIDREMIENTHCTDVICLLRQVPEVDVLRVTPFWTSVGARAVTNEFGDKVLVLIDGRENNIETFGVSVWQALPIHMEDIERIEVIRGPGSALYGANAHSAVVNITTRKTAGDGLAAFVGGGEHNRVSVHARADTLLGDWRLHLSGGGDLADHWQKPKETERLVRRVRFRAEREVGETISTAQIGFMSLEGQAFVLVIPAWVHDCLLTDVLLRHQTERLRGQLAFRMVDGAFDMDFPLYFGDTKLGEVIGDLEFLSTNLDAEAEANFSPFEGNLVITGADYRWVTFISDQVAPKSTHQHRVSAFLQDEQRLFDALILTAGVRLDYNNISPLGISPRLAAVWKMLRGQVLRAAFATAYRRPSFMNTSLHLTNVRDAPGMTGISEFVTRSLGNKDLENESITVFELGYHGRFLDDSLVVEADVFYNRYRNTINLTGEIYWDMGMIDLDQSVMRFENGGMEVDSLGGSISLTYRLKERLWLSGNYTFRHSWFTDIHDFADIAHEGDRVPAEPAHLLNLSFHYITRMGLRLGAAVHGSSERTFHILHGSDLFSPPTPVDVKARIYLSGFLAYRARLSAGWIEFGLRAYNLLNNPYIDRPSIAGRYGEGMGGETISRRLFFFVRGAL